MADTEPVKPTPVKKERVKYSYMLHHPDDLSQIGKYKSVDYRYAALKAVSRWYRKGLRRYLLRQTNTRNVMEFAGELTPLDKPKEIKRAGLEGSIKYFYKPEATFVKAWTLDRDTLTPQ